MNQDLSLRDKLHALFRVTQFRPASTIGLLLVSLLAAILEGIGLSFLLPIIELARDGGVGEEASGTVEVFFQVYQFFGVPFSLGTVIIGVVAVMTCRYGASFVVAYLRESLRTTYVRYLQEKAFKHALNAEIAYFDQQGSDEILNAIVTQSRRAGQVIIQATQVLEQGLISLMYLGIAVYLAPKLTLLSALVLGTLTFLIRSVLESGYAVGDRVADANERVQQAAQAGTQGIRDVKLFNMTGELYADFRDAAGQLVTSQIKLRRNQVALDNLYQLLTAVTVFVLIYLALRFTPLSLAGLGVFLFAMFRLAPRVSNLNNMIYRIDGEIPHLIRTQDFIDELERRREPNQGEITPPTPIETVQFEEVSFAYDTGEQIFDGLNFEVDRGEFIAFVGPSGVGKSTIVSLLTRMYQPDDGMITADGTPIEAFELSAWRDRVSVVRQNPFIFNDTLRENVTIGNRDADDADIRRACEIAQVTEFLDDLPDGYETVLGDDGVRLSGGQKQRVAIARALLKDADLLVLDEATSDLDSNIEETVHHAIESMDRDYAMLVIAHRLSTVINADRIYAIENGEVVESGSHENLIANNSVYADLYKTQVQQN